LVENKVSSEPKGERQRLAFMRFCLSGLVFTALGPGIFWMAYPLGPMIGIGIAELSVHSLRFLTFRRVIFPADKGYQVSLPRYIISAMPVTLACVGMVAVLKNRMGRIELTLAGAIFSLLVGFTWSRFIYTKPIASQQKVCL